MHIPSSTRLSFPQLLKAGGAAMLAAVLANVIARFILGALVTLAVDFQPFGLGPIITFTILFTLIGVVVLAVINWLTANPLKIYNGIGIVAFFVSIIPNLVAAGNPAAKPMGGNGADYLTLIVFHVVAAVAFLGVLNYAARRF